ncbi:hypothetical protein HDU96_007280 [Phlyctochytrium bullatum]|nr:hypothetical protein HDU96_007280 [Phlyctochytrium bullatum]
MLSSTSYFAGFQLGLLLVMFIDIITTLIQVLRTRTTPSKVIGHQIVETGLIGLGLYLEGLSDDGLPRRAVVLAWLLAGTFYMLVVKRFTAQRNEYLPSYTVALLTTYAWSQHPNFSHLVQTTAQLLSYLYILLLFLDPPAPPAPTVETFPDAEIGTVSEETPLLGGAPTKPPSIMRRLAMSLFSKSELPHTMFLLGYVVLWLASEYVKLRVK